MAHFSKLGINGKVIQVVPLEDKYLLDGDGNENEKIGQQYLERNHNWPAEMWIKTSYNTYKINTPKEELRLEEIMEQLVLFGMKIIKFFGLENHILLG